MSATWINYQEASKQLKNNNWPAFCLLTGKEPYTQEALLRAIKDKFIRPEARQVDLQVFDFFGKAKLEDLAKVEVAAMSLPFLSERKVVIVRNSGLLAGASDAKNKKKTTSKTVKKDKKQGKQETLDPKERLQEIVSALPQGACLILREDEVDKRSRKFIASLAEHGLLCLFDYEEDNTLQNYVTKLANKYQLEFTGNAKLELVQRADNQMLVLLSEFDKLCNFAQHNKISRIDETVVEDVCIPNLKGTVFNMTDAIIDGRAEVAFQLVDKLLAQGTAIQMLKFMFVRHIKQLLLAIDLPTEKAIAEKLKIQPFLARKLARQRTKFSSGQLESLYLQCFKIEHRIRKGELTDKLGFDLLLLLVAQLLKRR